MTNIVIITILIVAAILVTTYLLFLKGGDSDGMPITDDEDQPGESDNTDDNPSEESNDELDFKFTAVTKLPTFALIMGNSETDPSSYGSINRLEGVATDIKNIHTLLKNYGNIKNTHGNVLSDLSVDTFDYAAATSKAYIDAIKRVATLGKNIPGTKLLIIYESGHGAQVATSTDNDIDKQTETRVFFDKMIKDDETRVFIAKTLGKDWRVINILDRCHSGGMAKSILHSKGVVKSLGLLDKKLLKSFPKITKTTNEALIKFQSAASEDSYAMDYGVSVGGLFTSNWIESIVNSKGNITYLGANRYAATKCGVTQKPELQPGFNQNHSTWKDSTLIFN